MVQRADPIAIRSENSGTLAIPLFGALAVLVFVCVTPAVLNDGDTYWHIAAGSWMLNQRVLLRVDPFSYTFAGKPWQAHEWLSEILMALAYRLSGWSGIVLLAGAAFAATAGLLLWYLSRFLPAAAQGAVAALALACGAGSLLARPHLLALPVLTFWTIALLRARDERRAPSIWLTPLIALWANLHDSYLVGLGLIAVFAFDAMFDAGEDRLAVFRAWAIFAAVSAVMALATPFGINGILFSLHLMSMPALAILGEWQPMDFSRAQPIEVCVAALGYVWITRRMKVSAARIVLLAVLLYLAIAHVRHGMIAGVVGAAVLAEPLGSTFRAGGLSRAISGLDILIERRRLVIRVAAGVLLVLVAAVRLSMPVVRSDDISTPVSALRYLRPGLEQAPVLNDYAFGGYLIFAGIKPFIDSRAELYGDYFLREYARVIGPDPAALAETLAAHHIVWTIFAPGSPAVRELDRLGWRRLYADRWAVVHVRARFGETADIRQLGRAAWSSPQTFNRALTPRKP